MTSTTTSKPILSVDRINLLFNLRLYEDRSVRNLFVSSLRHPLESLTKKRELLHVLQDVSLTLRRGERLAVIGVNGSGKTSLCRCLAGMLHPLSGKVAVNGTCRAVFSTQVGIIPELTGRENGRLLARLLYPSKPDDVLDALVHEALEFSELGKFLDAPFETYSQGMRARLCLSIITAETADLLILDEVTDATDQFFRTKMTNRLHRFIQSSGAVIFVSHSLDQIRQLCNRAIVLHGRRIAFDGTVEEAFRAYESLNRPPIKAAREPIHEDA